MLPDTLLLNNEFRPYSEGERLNDFDFEGEVESELIAKHLIEQMDAHGGVGLTASQIGINARVFAFKENTGSSLINVVAFNPEIVSYSDEIALESEGCLSYPGLFIKIKRPKSLQVKYMTAVGQEIDTILGEFSARVFGHEFDPVSYTHLRAHETDSYLVCRLLLEKNFLFLMIRRPPRSTRKESSAASDVYKRQIHDCCRTRNRYDTW